MGPFILLFLAASMTLAAPANDERVHRLGKGVTEPILLKKVEPAYPPGASGAGVQGAVLLDIVVDSKGTVQDIRVLSPLGYGLDESAIDAVRQWRFRPGMKDGKPVAVRAEVEVFFRVLPSRTDISMERERTLFNMALQRLQQKEPAAVKRGIAAVREASSAGYVPAMYLEGVLLREGRLLAKDEVRAAQLIEHAANNKYGPAMAEVGKMYLTGQGKPLEKEKGVELLRSSAALGSVEGQFLLAQLYEAGNGVPRDLGLARKNYKLCAAAGEALCQERLAALLLGPQKTDRDFVEALAWLELAADHDLESARKKLEEAKANASGEDLALAAKLKRKLAKKQLPLARIR